MVTGGGAMYLNDAVRKEPRLAYTCHHHEQACAMAAEGYARVAAVPAVVLVTTGPGGINALNGVFGAYTDSVPMIVISGQVKRETCMATAGTSGLRQLGDQEVDIVSMARGVTKYAALVREPEDIAFHLDKALHLATSGRPGPVWLDVPVDVQGACVEPSHLAGYDPAEDPSPWDISAMQTACGELLDRIEASERPVILAGTGVRLAGAQEALLAVAQRLCLPITTGWTHDIIASDHPLYCGRPGCIGTRAGNFVVQNSDLLLVVGSRLNLRQVGYAWKDFAPHAFVVQVDADPAELSKPTVRPHLGIACDARLFLNELLQQSELRVTGGTAEREAWLAWCKERVRRYPSVLPHHRTTAQGVNPYAFVEQLFSCLEDDDVVVTANGAACVVTFQVAELKRGQRLFSNSGSASMGYDLPAAIGAAVARGGKRVICLAGDGSLQMNVQELQTVAHHRFPIKLMVLDNGGYLSIRTTQKNFFGALIGESSSTGVSFPDPVRVATAYGLPALRAQGDKFGETLKEALAMDGPCVVHVVLDPTQEMEPRPSSRRQPDGSIVSAPLHDLYPFLERDELLSNLLGPLKQQAELQR
jgi:acetolactate synthase-1/2/3 large subunit